MLVWPEKGLLGAPEVIGGSLGTRFGPNCRQLVTRYFALVLGLFWAPRNPKRASICTKLP